MFIAPLAAAWFGALFMNGVCAIGLLGFAVVVYLMSRDAVKQIWRHTACARLEQTQRTFATDEEDTAELSADDSEYLRTRGFPVMREKL